MRMTLMPRVPDALGEKSWYIPRWLDRVLPNITIESPHEGETVEPARSPAPDVA